MHDLTDSEIKDHKILIIDDDKTISYLLAGMVKELGFIPILAATGEEAKAMLSSGHFALCLLDLVLPDTTGQDLCQYIRSISSVPVVVLSTQENVETIAELLHLGADDYLVKPSTLSIIRSTIKAQMRRNTWNEAAKDGTTHHQPPSSHASPNTTTPKNRFLLN